MVEEIEKYAFLGWEKGKIKKPSGLLHRASLLILTAVFRCWIFLPPHSIHVCGKIKMLTAKFIGGLKSIFPVRNLFSKCLCFYKTLRIKCLRTCFF